MYSLRACIRFMQHFAQIRVEVGCELALQLREMRIVRKAVVFQVNFGPAIVRNQNIRVANSNRNRNCICK